MKKVGLVLEGGAMRGMYTAGVLDTLFDNDINIDNIIGVSAGALFGVNYYSKQKGRVIRYSKRFCKDLRYMSILSLILTGNIVNKNFAYYKVTEKYDPFDNNKFIETNKDFYAVVTNIDTGEAEYIKITNPIEEMEVLRATSAMPLVSKPVVINNKKYLDGAVSDSIPIKKMIEMGYDKIIVILTRPDDYLKEELNVNTIKRINSKYKKYPKLIEDMMERPKKYNKTLEYIKKLEQDKKIFVIKPSQKLDINVIERHKHKLQEVYDLGVNDARNYIKELKEYLK